MKQVYQALTLLLFGGVILSMPLPMVAQSCLEMIWSDEFENDVLNSEQWSITIGDGCPDLCGFGNNEQQYYSDRPENIKVENGRLIITAREDSLGTQSYSSARISSKRKGDFRYGRFEARMKLPQTQGMWPAFWMLPTEEVYGTWPQSGEIDILELIGSKPGQAVGTLHTGLPHTYISGNYNLPSGQVFADDFHVFAIEWEPDVVTWFVDGVQYHQLTPNDISPWEPFQEDFHLILNLAVGGNWPGPVDATTELPQTLEVDYVRVYNRPDRLSITGVQPIIEARGIVYSINDIADANYIWSVPANATITSGQGSHRITVDWGCSTGSVDLELQTSCDTVAFSYSVPDFIAPIMTGPSTVTENQSGVLFAIPQESNGEFMWQVPPGATIVAGQGSSEIVVDWGCDPGEVTVSFSSACGSTAFDTLQVDIQSYTITGLASVPPNTGILTYSIEEIADATYNWSVSSELSIVSGQGTSSIEIELGVSSGVVSLVVETPCGSTAYDFPITIERSLLYADFDNTDLLFIPYDGAEFEEVDNPSPSGINMSTRVGRVNKGQDSPRWAGVEADVAEIALDIRPVMTQKVLSSTTGIVRFMLDDETTFAERLKVDMEYGASDVNQWVQFVYDFSGAPANTYDQLRLTYNHFSTGTEFWYFDDVMGLVDENVSNIQEEAISDAILVFPNPSQGIFSIDTKDLFPLGDTYKLEVLNMQGRSVYTQIVTAQGQQVSMDLSDKPSGLYFLTVSGQSLRYVKAINKMD